MIRTNKLAIDPAAKQSIKTKIHTEIQKMKAEQAKGDKQAQQKIMILRERLRLIDSYRPFDETRIANLQKVFKHYCTHIFKTGKNMSFDRIQYENEHMTIQRFFAFINDFKLNQIPVEETNKQLSDRNNIILLFKKCSSNSRNLEFHQFVTCVERVFVLLFNQTQNYDRRQQKLLAQKKKRAQDAKKRQKARIIKLKRKKGEIIDEPKQKKEIKQIKSSSEQQQQEQQDQNMAGTLNKANSVKTSNQPLKQTNNPVANQPQTIPPTGEPNPAQPTIAKNTQNDELVKQMMKNFQIVNPTDQIKMAVKEVKADKIQKGQKIQKPKKHTQEEEEEPEIENVFDPYAVTNEQKIQSYMLRLGIDNLKLLQKKMRYFQKSNQKFDQDDPIERAMELKREKLKLLKKDSLTHYENGQMHPEWKGNRKQVQQAHVKKLISVRDKIEEIKMQKSKSHMTSSLPKQVYDKKKKSIVETFQRKQRELMVPYALARLTKLKQQQQDNTLHYSLEMIHRSTPNQLPLNKINPERYAVSDPTDYIFMEEYGYDPSITFKGRQTKVDLKLVDQTKKRVQQLQHQEEKKMNRLARNMYRRQQQQYKDSFLEKRY